MSAIEIALTRPKKFQQQLASQFNSWNFTPIRKETGSFQLLRDWIGIGLPQDWASYLDI